MTRRLDWARRAMLVLVSIAIASCATAPLVDSTRDDVAITRISRTAILLTPRGVEPAELGLVFYPGGLVDAKAYLPLLERVAASGFPTVVFEMPFDLAVLAPNRAASLIAAPTEPEGDPQASATARHLPERWVIGGHSLGGAMAARFAHRNLQLVEGLVLIAAFPAAGDSLADTALPVLSIYASNDGLATVTEIAETRDRLPLDTRFAAISGGNHAQFGSYGKQRGDGTATISREEQQRRTAKLVATFLTDRTVENAER